MQTTAAPVTEEPRTQKPRGKFLGKLLALAVTIAIVLALIAVTSYYQQNTISATGSRITTGTLSTRRVVTQTFTVEHRSLLTDLTLRFDTHYDQATVPRLYAYIRNDRYYIIGNTVDVSTLSNDTYCSLNFGPNVVLEPGEYTLYVYADDLQAGQIGVGLWVTDQCTEGSVLTVAGEEWPGYELCHYLTLQEYHVFSYVLVGMAFALAFAFMYLAVFPTQRLRALRPLLKAPGKANKAALGVKWGIWLVNPLLLFCCVEGLRYADHTLRGTVWLFTWLLLLGVQCGLVFLFGASLMPCAVMDGVLMVYALINLVVIDGRGYPIAPSDLFAIATAADVSSAYRLSLDARQLICCLLALALIAMEILLTVRILPRPDRGHWKRAVCIRLAALILGAGSLTWLWKNPILKENGIEPHIWNRIAGTNYNGAVLDFFINLQYLFVEKPEDYSLERAEEILQSYLGEDYLSETGTAAETPNIIYIMNESLQDFSMCGDLITNIDPLEYIHSLQEAQEVSWGRCYVSIFGAGTSNSEFEALTGHTMAYFPSGSNVYQQYMTSTTYSLPYYLKSLGYSTTAIHPCPATNWNRLKTYESMGFDAFLSIDDFEDPLIYRYISDQSCYEKIIETYEAKKDDGPVFIFNVTMQNHGSYSLRMDFPEDVNVLNGDYPKADQYLSSINLSDEAFAMLIDYFSNVEEPTMIVMFGDHQPSLESEFYNQHLGMVGQSWTLADVQEEYFTPYIVWTNYSDETEVKDISCNLLSNLVLDTAGIPLLPYQRFLALLQEQIPVMDAAGYQTTDGVWHSYSEETEVSQLLEDYHILQYAYYSDRNKSAVAELFGITE